MKLRRGRGRRGSRRRRIGPFRPTVRPKAVTPELLRERVLALCARVTARFAVVDDGIGPREHQRARHERAVDSTGAVS